ncbi:MAG: GTPase Era [Deltaproteobacteria bacterium]|nr:GTPase Era [Deltaproteobacteria bacterium]
MTLDEFTLTEFKCGYVALCGAPNTGKSTLLNRLVADKVAITSPKPQTTRHRLLGVVNLPQAQILFLDTPGIMDPKTLLNEALVRTAVSALNDADVVVWLTTPQENAREREVILSHLRFLTKPLIIALNKIDTIAKPEILPLMELFHTLRPEAPVVPLAALQGDGLPELVREIIQRLPVAPPFYPTDHLTDQTERFLAAEFVRERVFHHTSQEIPYAAAVQIEEFDESERPRLVKIRAVIFVERDSQKGIVIGKKGERLKTIGQEAREELEKMLDCQVYLELWVKVWKNWRKDPRALRELGYGIS